jgi:hypothetical protein
MRSLGLGWALLLVFGFALASLVAASVPRAGAGESAVEQIPSVMIVFTASDGQEYEEGPYTPANVEAAAQAAFTRGWIRFPALDAPPPPQYIPPIYLTPVRAEFRELQRTGVSK